MDVRADECELKVAEKKRDQWEGKYEATEAKYRTAKAELDELISRMEGL